MPDVELADALAAMGVDVPQSLAALGAGAPFLYDRWENRADATTEKGRALANVVHHAASGAGPNGHSWLHVDPAHATMLRLLGLAPAQKLRVAVWTNGDGAVGGSGGGTLFRLATPAGNVDLDSSQIGWVFREGQVTIGSDGLFTLASAWNPAFGDLVIEDLGGGGQHIEIDNWYNLTGLVTARQRAITNATRIATGGPGNRAYLQLNGAWLTVTGLTNGNNYRIVCWTNGQRTGGGTRINVTVESGTTQITVDDATGWVPRGHVVTVGTDGQIAFGVAFSPDIADVVIEDLGPA